MSYLLTVILSFTLVQPAFSKDWLPWGNKNKPTLVAKKELPNKLTVHEYRLSNGMQLLLVPDKSAPVFSFQVWFRVGSADEKLVPKLKRTGLAHLFEHMMFRGTTKYPDGKFDAAITAAGAAENNATTWLDRTNYFESLPKERLELVFDVESDRMVNLALDEKLFSTERGAVFGELKMNKDKPAREANNLLWDTAFDVHPYKYTTMGTPEELDSFTVEEAKYFYKTFYAPNNATLILVGDFKIDKALKLAQKYYGPLAAQEIPRVEAPVEPEQTKARYRKAKHPIATTDIMLLGYKAPDMNNPDIAALEVAGAVLAYGDGSLLEKALVQKGLVSSTYTSVYHLKYPSLFVFGNQLVKGQDTDDIREIIEEKISYLQSGKLTQQELDRGRNQFLLNAYNELGGNTEIGDYLGEALVSSGDYMRGFGILQDAKKVTLADVQRVAQKYFKADRSTEVILSPEKSNKSQESEQ